MSIHKEKIELFKKYYDKIQKPPYPVYIGEDIPSKLLSNAIKKYAIDIDTKKVIAMCDASLLGNGKSGFIFADRKFVFTELLGKSHTIYYSKIVNISLTDGNDISIHLTDGSIIKTYNSCMNMYALKEFLEDIIKFNEDNPDCPNTQIEKPHSNRNSMEELSILQESEDELSLQEVGDLLEGIKTEYENNAGDNETVTLLSRYIDSRKGESQKQENHCIEENIVAEQKQSFSEKHPIITGFGKFFKNASITVLGNTLNMSDDEIEYLKETDAVGFVENMVSFIDTHREEIADWKKEKAFKDRGIDYDEYKSMNGY